MRNVLRRSIARAAARLSDERWREMAAWRSVLGAGPRVLTPHARRVLVVAPHPDDETLIAGGTLARLVGDGAQVTALLATRGEASFVDLRPDALARAREREARAACAVLGVQDVQVLGLPDGRLHGSLAALTEGLERAVADVAPDLVVLPWFGDGHPDHRAVNEALVHVQLDDDVQVWGGEAWTPAPVNVLVDITDVVEVKAAALREHTTAARAFDLEAMLGLDRYRSVHGLGGRGYAEAFCALAAIDHRAAVARWLEVDVAAVTARG